MTASEIEVTWQDKRAIGIGLVQRGQWAVVGTVRQLDTDGSHSAAAAAGVEVGCVLSAINGRSALLVPYSSVIALLKTWEPPLTMRFRRTVRWAGILTKQPASINELTMQGKLKGT